jgi:hypothetical protein
MQINSSDYTGAFHSLNIFTMVKSCLRTEINGQKKVKQKAYNFFKVIYYGSLCDFA